MKLSKFSIFLLLLLLMLSSCNDIVENGDKTFKDTFSRDLYIKKESKILQNDEPFSVFTNPFLRSFVINDPVQIKATSKNTFTITSYSLNPIYNMEIWVKINTLSEEILLMTIKELPPLSQNEYYIPLCIESGKYQTKSGKYVYIEKIEEGFSSSSLSYRLYSDDEGYKKITSLKCNWKITFGGFTPGSQSNQNWNLMNGLYCRAYIALLTNFAYVYSSDEFETLFVDYYKDIKKLYNPNLSDNECEFKKNSSSYFTTKDEYVNLVKSIRSKSLLNCGITAAYEGLGGGNTYGISPHYFNWHYYNVEQAGVCAIVHEFGHCMGYGHDSDFCYGFFEKPFLIDVYDMLIKLDRMPYSEPPDECNMFLIENEGFRYTSGKQIKNYKNIPWGSSKIENFITDHLDAFPKVKMEIKTLGKK